MASKRRRHSREEQSPNMYRKPQRTGSTTERDTQTKFQILEDNTTDRIDTHTHHHTRNKSQESTPNLQQSISKLCRARWHGVPEALFGRGLIVEVHNHLRRMLIHLWWWWRHKHNVGSEDGRGSTLAKGFHLPHHLNFWEARPRSVTDGWLRL